MGHTITLKDLARQLGISPSTVSRALKDNPEISPDTRRKVQELAKQLNYEPNALALSLRHSKTNTIGVVLPEIVHFFFSTVISGIEDVAYAKGYNIIICQSNESMEREISDTKAMFNHRVDGILACVSKNTTNFDHFNAIQDKGIPLVFFDRKAPLDASSVLANDFQGAYDATKHLLDSGRRNIIHLAGPEGLMLTENRKNGFLKAHEELNLSVSDDQIITCGKGEADEATDIIEALLKEGTRFDGIFAVNDIAAFGALKAVQRGHLSIPKDAAIVGYSDWMFSAFVAPTMSTVDQQGYEMGQKAAELLLQEINSKDQFIEPTHIELPTALIVRESSQ